MPPLANDAAPPAAFRKPGFARAALILAHLTFAEARRRRILAAALILGSAFVALFAVGLHFIARDVRATVPLRQQRVVAELRGDGRALRLELPHRDDVGPGGGGHPGRGDRLRGDRDALHEARVPSRDRPRQVARLLGPSSRSTRRSSAAAFSSWRVSWSATPRPNAARGLALILLEGTVLLTLALLGGTRLSTLANGITVFGLYGLAFIGGWMEQIGTLAGNATARYIGIAAEPPRPQRIALAARLAPHAAADRARHQPHAVLACLRAEPGHGRMGRVLRPASCSPSPPTSSALATSEPDRIKATPTEGRWPMAWF